MSERYPGGVISRTPPTVSKNPPSAPGVWTIEQQAAYQRAGTWPYGGPFNYIEDVFSTFLYTGNDTPRSIVNGIDLAGKGGLVWIKGRSGAQNNILVSETPFFLVSNTTAARVSDSTKVSSFNSNGFSIGNDGSVNNNNTTFVSWTFRKQEKFFDVVTWTGNGTNNRQISHSLGSTPGCIIVKETSQTGTWYVYHRSNGTGKYMSLNNTNTVTTAAAYFPAVTSTTFTPTSDTQLNTSTVTYVAYLFAHDAGGFGLTGTDNVVSCGSYVGNSASAGQFINLGYEPQWVLQKNSTGSVQDWHIQDIMRGAPVPTALGKVVRPNSNIAEYDGTNAYPAATGFYATGDDNNSGTTYIYVAIRRGPMKTPTTGTSVFTPRLNTGTGTNPTSLTGFGFPPDLSISAARNLGYLSYEDKLRGPNKSLTSSGDNVPNSGTSPEYTTTNTVLSFDQDGITMGNDSTLWAWNLSSRPYVKWNFRRAPSFFDMVCYTGTGSATTQAHNLNAVPELMIVKNRTSTGGYNWFVYHSALGNTRVIVLDTSAAAVTISSAWNNTTPTSTVFSVGTAANTNRSGDGLIAYLFASCPGVSKVGSYSGTGGTQTISCGFAARFVLIKRTDSSADWFVWDTARGMVAGTDPRFPLSAASPETNADWVYTNASGFQIVTTDATVNASGGTYIYLAIA